ncbi:MAG: pyridoxal phosphate-dependent aminotransferase [Ignavibacteriae bacterium]|nr:pyridoxal phosphate-dependent aminotransferase [Ignavibacteriota bacterium]
MISLKIKNIDFSGTMEIAAKTIEMQNSGIDVVNLCVGEPDLPTPDHIKEAAQIAIKNNHTKYASNSGLKELKISIQKKYEKEYNVKFSLDEIIVSNGAKQSVYNAIQTIIDENDEVIIPAPYYVSYVDMVKLAGGVPKTIQTSAQNNFKITVKEIEQNINSKTKAIILCNPSNPTGAVFTQNELIDIVEVSIENNLSIISDEIYEKLIYDSLDFTSIATLGKKVINNSIIINGVSKSYSMTGWRIGYALANKTITEGMNKLQSHSTSSACTISQHAAIAALNGFQECVELQRKIFEERRNYIINELEKIDLVSFTIPAGAFYFFVDISKAIEISKTISNSRDFCLKLLNENLVATVPGSVFGMEGFIRISYSKSMDELKIAMKRFIEFLEKL